jgi:enoyl-CoA hydratase/carnithine racemase
MSGDTPLVHIERRADGVAVVRLDNPKVNALSSTLLRQLEAAATALTEDPPGAVVVTGGDRLFAAGADISEFGGPDEARTVGGAFHNALDAVAAIPRVVIAAVSGFALGGGCELALACDLRVVSEKARFGQPEILLGASANVRVSASSPSSPASSTIGTPSPKWARRGRAPDRATGPYRTMFIGVSGFAIIGDPRRMWAA